MLLVRSLKHSPEDTWYSIEPDYLFHTQLSEKNMLLDKAEQIGTTKSEFEPLASMVSTVFQTASKGTELPPDADLHFELTVSPEQSTGLQRRSIETIHKTEFILHSRTSIRPYHLSKVSLIINESVRVTIQTIRLSNPTTQKYVNRLSRSLADGRHLKSLETP